VQLVYVGDPDIAGGRAVHAGILGEHDPEPHLPGPDHGQVSRLANRHLEFKAKIIYAEFDRGIDIADFEIRPAAQQVRHAGESTPEQP
jgi:hypothetical protein